MRRVANDVDTYIPTTTISIDDDSVDDDTRGSLDDINLLSSKRKNQLLGSSEANKTWTLDSGSIDSNTKVLITLETIEGEGESVEFVAYQIENDSADYN